MRHFSLSQIVLLCVPPVLLITTYAVFRYAADHWGAARGYLVGFVFYWVWWCFLAPLLTVGPGGLGEMFQAPRPILGKARWLGIFLLAGPPLVMFVARFPAEIKGAGPEIVIYSALFALANGALEEVLWRGAYVTAFPDSWLWGWLYPAIWFGLWHLSPQAVYPSEMPGGAIAFALMSIPLGLVWGWVAKTTGSIRWTVVAHILLNFAGLAGPLFIR